MYQFILMLFYFCIDAFVPIFYLKVPILYLPKYLPASVSKKWYSKNPPYNLSMRKYLPLLQITKFSTLCPQKNFKDFPRIFRGYFKKILRKTLEDSRMSWKILDFTTLNLVPEDFSALRNSSSSEKLPWSSLLQERGFPSVTRP